MQVPLPEQLWLEFKHDFMEDYIHAGMSRAIAGSRACHDIVQHLADLGKNPREILNLDVPLFDSNLLPVDSEEPRAKGQEEYKLLNSEQKVVATARRVVDEILHTIENPRGQCTPLTVRGQRPPDLLCLRFSSAYTLLI